ARSLAGDAERAEALGLASALELRAQGINVVFAPVADITGGDAGVIGNRSYSDDPTVVANMVVATINGLQRGGVAATVKHWPGHGDTTVDSHSSLPVIDVSPDIWSGRERVPFAAAVEAGVEMVMVGHLAMPQLDPSGVSATQSPLLVDGLLRSGLGYDGVIVSDALDMGALDGEDRGEVAVESIEAGIDLLLAPPDIIIVQSSILAALESGRLTDERLDESVRRILTLKLRLGLLGAEP
ncbi:MAG: glycoside hydrolase family 3 N-terminal domain-containing protein, partial [Acidimicrobiales bacterium]